MYRMYQVRVPLCNDQYWLWLATYDTQEEFYRAEDRYEGTPDWHRPDEDITGLFNSDESDSDYLGIMRLYDTSFGVVVHESVHAAVALANKEHGMSRSISRAKEETIAYATQYISAAVMEKLCPLHPK